MAGSGTLQVSVEDSVGDAEGDNVALYLSDGASLILCGLATLDNTGSTTFNNLSGGNYVVQVQGPDDRGDSAMTTLGIGAASAITVSLMQQGSVSGVVEDASGNPISRRKSRTSPPQIRRFSCRANPTWTVPTRWLTCHRVSTT